MILLLIISRKIHLQNILTTKMSTHFFKMRVVLPSSALMIISALFKSLVWFFKNHKSHINRQMSSILIFLNLKWIWTLKISFFKLKLREYNESDVIFLIRASLCEFTDDRNRRGYRNEFWSPVNTRFMCRRQKILCWGFTLNRAIDCVNFKIIKKVAIFRVDYFKNNALEWNITLSFDWF